MRRLCLNVLIIFLFAACELSTDWDLSSSEEPKLVVEAILTNENKIQEIQLSLSFSELNELPQKVENARVTLTANGITYHFKNDENINGLYKSERAFEVLKNLDYELIIEWNDEVYKAKSQLSSVAAMPKITFNELPDSNQLTLADFAPLYNPNQQAMYEIDIDWSHLNQEGEQRAKVFLYTFSSVHLSALARPDKELISFPKGSQVIVKKYGLNEDFAEYLRAKAIETEWNGAFFYSTAENLPSNISNNALGFYSACSVLVDTLIAK